MKINNINEVTKIAKKELIQFLAITFLVSWGIWIPMLLLSDVLTKSLILGISMIGVFAPSITALYLVTYNKGVRGLKDFLGACFKPILPKWMIPLILLLVVFIIISHMINVQLGVPFPTVITNPIEILVVVLIQLVLVTVSEEIGWRGYAQQKFDIFNNDVMSGLFLGTIWAIWHIPAFLSTAMPHHRLPFIQFYITVVIFSIFVSMAQRVTKQSIWSGILLHGLINAVLELIPFLSSEKGADYNAWIIFNAFSFLLLMTVLVIRKIKIEAIMK